ncbi:unnamed protein product [Phytophthora fragariaefolia]|uniref:Unnamed protein product n=1 Tax=Phytophthora fragariaefolia TaxID=1490495 RepID=A0A9W7CYG7_9STRA|nr:unnamed protein product [Phytophthora fragariaefolia]
MRSPRLRLQIPNPFDAAGADSEEPGVEDEEMPSASSLAGQLQQRVSAIPALPEPPRFEGRTMKDRRNFMRGYETYLTDINALQTQWSGAFAMPVGACIEGKAKRMVARYEFNCSPERISEEQWVAYFKQANEPSHIDYAVVDEAMKQLRMQTKWPEPESRMMNLQADLEAILDHFNLDELAFEHEQRHLVGVALVSSASRRTLRARRESAPPTSMRRLQVADDISEDRKLERTQDAGTVDATVDGLEVKVLLLDSGADTSLVARGVIDALQAEGILLHLRRVADQELKLVGSGQLVASRVVQFKEVMLATPAGPLMLRNQ